MQATRDLLLRRRGLVFVDAPAGEPVPEDWLRAIEADWAALGFVPSARLRARLGRLPGATLGALHADVQRVLLAKLGAAVRHEPLFTRFPHDVPADTLDLWWRRVLVHFMQAPDQPCLFCLRAGTTHLLNPCQHVVCDRCFDFSAHAACPVCGRRVDQGSPFLQPTPERPVPRERVKFKLLDLGGDVVEEARALLVALCQRKQPLSQDDEADLTALLTDVREDALAWLPATIPLKENVAAVFATLFRACDPGAVLPVARRHLKTATDVLRFLAALSGVDPGLLPTPRVVVARRADRARWGGALGQALRTAAAETHKAIQVRRFKVAKLPRPLRRALLELLEGFDEERLLEDVLRHRAAWVGVGERLHPAEHAARFPRVARAFEVARRRGPDGRPAPDVRTFASRVEAAAKARDVAGLVRLLVQRPGDLARRYDHALRLAAPEVDPVLGAFVSHAASFATPVLLTLRAHLPARARPAPARVYWPKAQVALGPSGGDARPPLPARAIEASLRAIDRELLARFGGKAPFDTVLVDVALRRIVAPFNERGAARAAVALPRGSRVHVPPGQVVRLFLHWCEPEVGGRQTDIDLSVGFYDAQWRPAGVCSYYSLRLSDGEGAVIATSSGDFRSAPFPRGASEFVDVDRARALAAGFRYAVMVVNAYSGMSFSQLHRGFAGLMLRDDAEGTVFDPRTVELRFDLQGENGVYLPLALDLQADTLHWLDVQSKGQLALNNVSTSSRAITRLCPTLMAYFESGARPSLFDLALLHAAARGRRVLLRDGERTAVFERQAGEEPAAFLARLQAAGDGAEQVAGLPDLGPAPVLAALHDGDVDLPQGSAAYVLFPRRTACNLSAADLVS